MNSIIIGHPDVFASEKVSDNQVVSIAGVDISIGIIETEQPVFYPELNPSKVLVKKLAFSCNYRDKGACLQIFNSCLKSSTTEHLIYSGFGSEFVAEVLSVGINVTTLAPGDKVIPNGAYPQKRVRTSPGLPTNFSSERFSIFDEEQLVKVPQSFDNMVAASLTIAGQTIYSIIRRAEIQKGQSVLLTAASSNTSLFAMKALKNEGVNIVGLTSSPDKIDTLKALGYPHVVMSPQFDPEPLQKLTNEFGGFDIIIDPFSDLYLSQVVNYMNFYSKYFTCGIYRQSPAFDKSNLEGNSGVDASLLSKILFRNISIIGNCLGTKQDLEKAVADVTERKIDIIIDSFFSGYEYGNFFKRTFSDSARVGKVVYVYE